jgi:UPF0716 protein FxsA
MSSFGASPPGRLQRRPRARLVRAAVAALPLLELALLLVVGRVIGFPATLMLLLAGLMAGVLVLLQVGRAALRGLQQRSDQFDGRRALLVPAALLLVVPGFLSDAAGLLLLVPAVRRRVATRLGEAVIRRLGPRTIRVVPGEVVPGEVVPGEIVPGEVVPGEIVDGP